MSGESSMILVGIGTAGSAIARGVDRAFGGGLRLLLADTDATTGEPGGPFTLLGGDRLSGRGSGGDVVAGRLAAEDSVKLLDEHLNGVRLAVIVTALGGGTGGGATLEAAKHLSSRGIPSVVFATWSGSTRTCPSLLEVKVQVLPYERRYVEVFAVPYRRLGVLEPPAARGANAERAL